jgi:Family of unknown function (DUF5670)
MFLAIGIFLLVAWIFGFVFFKVTAFAIHILLIVALIAVITHFVKRKSSSP